MNKHTLAKRCNDIAREIMRLGYFFSGWPYDFKSDIPKELVDCVEGRITIQELMKVHPSTPMYTFTGEDIDFGNPGTPCNSQSR